MADALMMSMAAVTVIDDYDDELDYPYMGII